MNLSGLDLNTLKQLLASGQITQADLQGANLSGSFGGQQPQQPPQNALQTMVNPAQNGPSGFGVQDNQRMAGLAQPRLGDLDHELVETQDHQLSPEELAMRDALWSGAGDKDASARIEDLVRQRLQQPSTDDLRKQGAQFVRNESTGQTIYMGPNGQASDRPTYGSQIQSAQGQSQPSMMQVIGTSGGSRVQLSPEQAPDKVNLDYSQNPLQLFGGAKAIYSKDEPGVAYVMGPDGRPKTKVLLGYDMQGSMALNKANMEMAKDQAQIGQTQAATEHTLEETRASRVNNPDFSSMGAGGGGAGGPDLLKSLDPGTAATVQAMLDGRMQPPGQMALRNPRVLQLINVANQVDPSFDATTWVNRYKTAQDFSSAGKSGTTLTSFNTALEHLARLQQSGAALDNSRFPIWNNIANTFEANIGDPRIKQFQADKDALTGELTKAFNSGHITDAQLAKWGGTIDASNSPQQLEAAYKEFVGLLGSKMNELGNTYERGMGKSLDRSKFMSPEAMQVYKSLSGQSLPGITSGGQPQVQQGQPAQAAQSNIPPQAVAFLKSNPAARYDFDRKYGQGASAQVLAQ